MSNKSCPYSHRGHTKVYYENLRGLLGHTERKSSQTCFSDMICTFCPVYSFRWKNLKLAHKQNHLQLWSVRPLKTFLIQHFRCQKPWTKLLKWFKDFLLGWGVYWFLWLSHIYHYIFNYKISVHFKMNW